MEDLKTKDEIINQAIVRLGFSNAHLNELNSANQEAVVKEAMELWGKQSNRVMLRDIKEILRLTKQLADKILNR